MAAWVRLNSQLGSSGILAAVILILANLGTVTALTMYPRPFDFAGRTGTVSLDVSNDTSDGGLASASASATVTIAGTTACQFMSGTATAAFCKSVASANPGGRAGDLDNSKWSVSRTLAGRPQREQPHRVPAVAG